LADPPVAPDISRNCMPSLHTAWALALWWQARALGRRARIVTGFFLVFTLLATLGFGLHYAFDLVVAVPFTLTVRTACLPAPAGEPWRRRRVVLSGAALTLGWLILLRIGLHRLDAPPLLMVVAVLATA